jgi:hypothetical protein
MLNQFCKLRAIKENERVRGREKIIPPVKEKKNIKKNSSGVSPFYKLVQLRTHSCK